MKLIFNDKEYELKVKSKMRNMWYSAAPLKFTILSIPRDEWVEMLDDEDFSYFTILKEKGECIYFRDSDDDEIELWNTKVSIDSAVISSIFKDGVRVVINLAVFEEEKQPIREIRNILLKSILR